jgi:3-phenylpropionate/trans-cinnamate dioxygenase ferredoxin reductase subunit
MSGMVVVGGSYAGVQSAVSARESGYQERITIISDEAHLPYKRPPLSKDLLLGKSREDSIWLRTPDYFRNNSIELLLGKSVVEIDRQAKQLTFSDGDTQPYDVLVLACGAQIRRLQVSGSDRADVHYLRTLDDSVRLRGLLECASSVAIVGGGFVGLEVAAAARAMGKEVTVIEAAPRLLQRAVSQTMSDFVLELHRGHGTDIMVSETAERIDGRDGDLRIMTCNSGRAINCDLIVAGIGSSPNDQLAKASGLATANGIVVDELCRTVDDAIFAAGDCSNHPSDFAGGRLRLESVQNALDQGRTVGSTIAGRPLPYSAVPRFWSDQFDCKLQMTGLLMDHDSQAVRGDVEQRKFSIFMYQGPRLTGIESVNRPGDQLIGRKLLASGRTPLPHHVIDLSFDLRQIEAPGSSQTN